jgi:nonsense-mediated mRNA decay protein 3
MVCPLCGKKSEVGMFCTECYLKKNLEVELPGKIELQYCSRCDAYLLGGKWIRDIEEEDAILKAVQNALKTNIKRLEKTGAITFDLDRRADGYIARVEIVLGKGKKVKESKVTIRKTVCPECSRRAGGYFEAVLQFRGAVGKKKIEEVANSIEKHKDKFSFVSGIKRVTGGYDIYVGSKKSAEKIVKQFRGEADIKKSFKHAGYDHQKGKPRSRFYYLIRL